MFQDGNVVRISAAPPWPATSPFFGFYVYGPTNWSGSFRWLVFSTPNSNATVWAPSANFPAGQYTVLVATNVGAHSVSFTWTNSAIQTSSWSTNQAGSTNYNPAPTPTPTPTPSPTPMPWSVSATVSDPPLDYIGKTLEIRDLDTGAILGSAVIGASGAVLSFTVPSGVNNVGTYVDGVLVATGSRSDGSSTVVDPTPYSFKPESVPGATNNHPFAGQQISVRNATNGSIMATTVVNSDGSISRPAAGYVPMGVTAVNYFVGDTMVGSGFITNGSSSSFVPSINANPMTISANPGATAFGSSAVQGQVIYQGGAIGSGLSPGQVLWSGSIPPGGVGSIITNLALPAGSVYSFQAQIPQMVYTNVGDGVGAYVAVGTNTYTFTTNVPSGGGSQSFYVQPPVANSLPPPILAPTAPTNAPTSPFANNVTSTNFVTVTNSASSTNEEPVEVTFTGIGFTNSDYGESDLIARGTSILGKITGTISNVNSGFSNIASAATIFAGVSVPDAGGGCSVNLGGHTITLSSPPGVRQALVYLAWLGVIIAIGSMLWDLTKS